MRMNERRTKISSVKRKLTNKTLVQKCEIIRHIEKGMTNKEASKRFGVPKNTISTWIKNKEKLLAALQETASHTKKIERVHCSYFYVTLLTVIRSLLFISFFSFSFPEIYELLISISNSLYLEQIPWSLASSR